MFRSSFRQRPFGRAACMQIGGVKKRYRRIALIAQRDITRFAIFAPHISLHTRILKLRGKLKRRIPIVNVALFFGRVKNDVHDYVVCTIKSSIVEVIQCSVTDRANAM